MTRGKNIESPVGQVERNIHSKNPQFVADPVAFIQSNPCTLCGEIDDLGGTMGSTTMAAFNRSSIGTKGYEYLSTGTVRLAAEIRTDPYMNFAHRITVYAGSDGKKVCFLPWKENFCSITALDAAADLFLTGPLSGCHIYFATKSGFPPMVFHANANDDDMSSAQNKALKDNLAMNIASSKGYKVVKRLARGEYEIPAFVWGSKAGTDWNLFVHEIDIAGGSGTNAAMKLL
jgi:hypothetical protein